MADREFRDRRDAGGALAQLRTHYREREDVVVLALPRGGVPVGYELATALSAPLDVFIVRKLGVPGHEELAMGAIASGGVVVLLHDVGAGDYWIVFGRSPDADHILRQARLERAIGVIYRPQTERQSHYFDARLADQFDAVIHIDETRASSRSSARPAGSATRCPRPSLTPSDGRPVGATPRAAGRRWRWAAPASAP